MQVRLLIGRDAGQIVEMPYAYAVANRDLGHVEFVTATVERMAIDAPESRLGLHVEPTQTLDVAAPRRPRGRPPGPRRASA